MISPLLVVSDPNCPPSATFFGMMGVTSALVFCSLGASYGSAKAGLGIAHVGIAHPEILMKSLISVIMAGILGIYGLIISILLISQVQVKNGYSAYQGYAHLTAGLACGLSCLASGLCIGVVGDAGTRAFGKQKRVYLALIMILIMAEALGLYGLITAVLVVMLIQPVKCAT
jgi:V-type H+-transporting ATPase proteolipid subunit